MKQKKKKSIAWLLAFGLLVHSLFLGGCIRVDNSANADSSINAENSTSVDNSINADNDSNIDVNRNTNASMDAEDDTDEGDSHLEVHFIDVGQGDATFISCDGYTMLIDAGNNDKGTTVWSYLKQQGVEKLDYVIGTHPDADHIGGLDVVLYKFDCGMIFMPDVKNDTKSYEDVEAVIKEKNETVTSPVVGETYALGQAAFTILAPNKDYGTDLNNSSIVILLEHGKNRFLLTGDAEEEAEEDILANGLDISADVYKAGHHGSKTASTEQFLETVNPTYAVISCGENNSYGHPHAEVLNRFRMMGIEVFRTDEQGTIVAVSDGKEISWNMTASDSWQAGEPTGSSVTKEVSEKDDVSTKEQAEENLETQNTESTESTDENADTLVYITKSGEKYHRASCSYLKSSGIEITLSEAKEKGYEACKKCQPPQ